MTWDDLWLTLTVVLCMWLWSILCQLLVGNRKRS